ncbi:hypothetical protein BDY17DRAFT_310056 [Neohortaea acidophila]|uniref:Uncharacterized protein n=1 Tax=Neohortaea acidophila TaxID=245834 RepID=A0A6A6PS89_9PEZI|nr:uncharacterized protein BDY17DRAFT_310056 [Neohortaea acidophila]KAF2482970.1 hypothetical protein BDY17DRAFT_310056 [Neohortaea acidophila]
MSFTSSPGFTPLASPATSVCSAPRSIQSVTSTRNATSAPIAIYHTPSPTTNSASHEYSSSMLNKSNSTSRPSAYVSDEDLLGDDEVECLREAPPPPRTAEHWTAGVARPLLPPVVMSKPRVTFHHGHGRRRSSVLSIKKRG